jgi:cell division protein FtsA
MGDFVFDMPARMGHPNRTGGLMDVVKSTAFATSVGLLMYGYENEKPRIVETENDELMVDKLNDFGRRLKGIFAKSL